MADEGYIFDKAAAGRVVRATRWVERQGHFSESADYGPPMLDGDYWIEITGSTLDGGTYYHDWKHKLRLSNSGGQWVDHPDGVVSSDADPDTTAITPDGSQVETGKIVRAIVETGEDGVATYTIIAGGGTVAAGTLFAVDLSAAAGSAGSASTTCAFTYTVTDKLGNVLLTIATPECAREVGLKIAATRGTAYYNSDGDPVLFWANELDDGGQPDCTP